MPNPTRSDVHVNTPLTNISIAYLQNSTAFVADKVFPNIPVTKQSDRYYTYERGEFNRDEAELRAPGTESAGGGYTLDNTPTYSAQVRAFHKDIDDQVRANSDSVLAPDREATEYVTHKMLIRREKQWVTDYFAGGIWSRDFDGTTSGPSGSTDEVVQWDNYASSDPITDVRDGVTSVTENTGFIPNTLVLGFPVFQKLLDHPDIVDRIKYGQSSGEVAVANLNVLAQLFGVERVFVPRAIENTAAEGQTASHSFISGKKALLVYSAPTPGLMTPSAGYTFSWTGFLGATQNGIRIKRFRMEQLSSDRVEGEIAFDTKLISADLGAFWDTIIA